MAEKFLKVIQGGIESFIPDTKRNREFWAKQNANIGRGKNSENELTTVIPASEEEAAFMQQQPQSPQSIIANASTVDSNELAQFRLLFLQQQEQMASQQILINQLLSNSIAITPIVKGNDDVIADSEASKEEGKEKGKPGPKPKTQSHGESIQTEDHKA